MQKDDKSQAYGNAEVVQLLKIWLKRAREGKICHATLTVQMMPNLMACDFAGSADLEFAIPYALDTLKLKMFERARIHSKPAAYKEMSADYVCYNLGNSPVSFDFLPWLISAEMTRVREGAPGPLKIAFARGQDGKSGLDNNYRRTMFTGVVRPLIGMLGAVEDQAAMSGKSNQWFVLREVTAAARNGEKVPKLVPHAEAMKVVAEMLRDSPPPVTITLRELDTWAHRNSNMSNWIKFADFLKGLGQRVIFVRDTAKAGEPMLGYETFPLASTNLHIRQALYEQAGINYFVPNGPWNLQLFGTKPWILFNEVKDDDPFFPNTPKFWSESQGIEAGTQFPWSTRGQRIVWKRDDYDNLVESWHNLYE